ncbi:MAG: hypothetical protein H0X62_17675, partial [Bacteroidetes bacterium]|nr:hypothetical protein [Bacteroidota bacterium]
MKKLAFLLFFLPLGITAQIEHYRLFKPIDTGLTYDLHSPRIIETTDGYLLSGIMHNHFLSCRYIIKTDKFLNYKWAKMVRITSLFNDIAILPNGDFIATDGYSSQGKNKPYLYKFKPNGDNLWVKEFDNPDSGSFGIVKALANGELLITGSLETKNCLIKCNDNGEIIWSKSYGNNSISDILQISDSTAL